MIWYLIIRKLSITKFIDVLMYDIILLILNDRRNSRYWIISIWKPLTFYLTSVVDTTSVLAWSYHYQREQPCSSHLNIRKSASYRWCMLKPSKTSGCKFWPCRKMFRQRRFSFNAFKVAVLANDSADCRVRDFPTISYS